MTDELTRHNRATYDRVASAYVANRRGAAPGPPFAALADAFVVAVGTGATVGDLGCGPGHDGAALSACGLHVVGVDLSSGMLAHAVQALGLVVAQGDLRALPLRDSSLDGVWCCAALLHVAVDDTASVLGELHRVLRPGGVLALVTALGDGTVEEPVPYAPEESRWFVYREPAAVDVALADAGLTVELRDEGLGNRRWGSWLARRPADA